MNQTSVDGKYSWDFPSSIDLGHSCEHKSDRGGGGGGLLIFTENVLSQASAYVFHWDQLQLEFWYQSVYLEMKVIFHFYY